MKHFINPANKIEHELVINPEFYFKKEVIIRNKKKALNEAKKYKISLIFYIDGSKLELKNMGATIC